MDLNLLPNNAMTFSENQHGNAVLDKLKAQREKNRCCDVILHVNGRTHHAHRCVLSACSPFFDSFFKSHKTVREQITISSQSSEVVLTLLGYMYTGTVIIDTKNVSELLKLADTFLLSKLKEYCVEYLQRYLDTRNCLTIWEMSNRFGLESLQKNASNHIALHLQEVLGGEEVLGISQIRLENFIKNSNWQISNERILNLITSWVYHSAEERESAFRSLLTWVSWKDISPQVVVCLVQVHPLLSSSKKCRAFLMDVLDENDLLSEPAYSKIADLRCTENEKLNLSDDYDFINIAITTAINESNVEKYLMDSRKDLLKMDLTLSEQSHYEFRDTGQSNNPDPNSDSQLYHGNHGKKISPNKFDSTFQSGSGSLQTIDIEELCKYTLENTQKQRHYLGDVSDNDRVSPALKDCDYDTCSYNDHQVNYHHCKDFREGDHFKAQSKACPKFTNKVSYMNHKYDVNHSNELSFTEPVNTKNSAASLEFNSPIYQLDFSKDGPLNLIAGNYSDEHLGIHLNQDPQYHPVEPLSPVGYKTDHFAVTDDLASDVKGTNALIDHNVNLNSVAYMKASSFIPSQPEFLYMDGSNDTQSSNNYPKDMSLPHLKLSECHNSESFYQNPDNTYPEISSNDMQTIDDTMKEKIHDSTAFDNSHQNYDPNFEQGRQQTFCPFENKGNEFTHENIDRPSSTTPTGQEFINNNDESIDLFDKSTMNAHVETTVNSNWDDGLPKDGERNIRKDEKKDIKKAASEKLAKKVEVESMKKVVKTCEVCAATFDRKKNYFSHIVEHFPGPPFRCDTCCTTFKRIYHLLDHRKIHLEKKSFECSQCSFATHKMFNLKEHMLQHTSERPFKCDECGDCFNRKQHLNVHLTKHTSDRPLICETCGWSAKTRNSLLTHSKVHTGDLYTCQYPDCPYRTAKKSHLKEHMQFHTKSRPFACKICGMRFISKAHVMRHLRKHENPNFYQCSQCDYCASRLDSLKRHIKRKHSTTKPKLRIRKGQLKKKDALLSNKKTEISPISEQTFMPNLNNSNGRLSPNSLPLLSESFSNYHPPSPSHSPCTFGAPGDPDDPLTIVSEIEDNQSSYLNSNIGQTFSGLLDTSCGGDRFILTTSDELYYD